MFCVQVYIKFDNFTVATLQVRVNNKFNLHFCVTIPFINVSSTNPSVSLCAHFAVTSCKCNTKYKSITANVKHLIKTIFVLERLSISQRFS